MKHGFGARGLVRLGALGMSVALPLCGAVAACTAGDDLAYDRAGGDTNDGGDGGEGGLPKIVVPGDATVLPRIDDGGSFEAAAPFDCPTGLETDPEALSGCLPSAGLGCCLGMTGGNKCYERVQVEIGTACKGIGEAFVTCTASTDDNTCCWYRGDAGGREGRGRRVRIGM